MDYPIMQDVFSPSMEKLVITDKGHANVFNERYQTLLNNDNYLKCEIEKNKATCQFTLPAADWSTEAPYTQTVPVEGMTEMDSPIPGIQYPDDMDEATKKAIDKSAGMLTKLVTANGGLMAECKFKKPAVDIPLVLKGV